MYCQKCGLKLPDSAGECDICGHPVSSSGRGTAVALVVIVFILLTIVIFQVRGQSPDTAVASEANPAAQAQAQNGPEVASSEPVNAPAQTSSANISSADDFMKQVNPSQGYRLPAVYGDLGPQLLEAGAIDYDRFVQTYERSGQPLTESQLAILTKGSDEPVVVNQENAYFLLNFFWAAGLTNQNVLLTDGPMTQYSEGDVSRFASTGGWTLGTRPATELYASTPLMPLTSEQLALVAQVAAGVYRPCCNNPTAFPDCNHGMAMLGLLELMASQGATEDEMFEAAKYINAFWFPQQAMETAVFFKATMDLDYADVDGRMAVGPEVFSSSGFQGVHQWLVEGGELPQAPQSGPSCGV